MALFGGSYPGNQYRLDLGTSVSGTTINAWSDVTQLGGSGWQSDAEWCRIRISGVDTDGWWAYDYTVGADTKRAISASRNVGYGSFLVETWVEMYFASYGTRQAYEASWVTITNPATVPPAPTPIGLDMITPTGMRYRFSGNGDGGSPILRWDYQCSTDPTFSGVPWAPSTGTTVRDDLQPGVTYFWRSRGVNAVGAGTPSTVSSARTLALMRRGKGGQFVPAQVSRGKGGGFVPAEVYIGRGGVFVPAR